MKLSEIITGAAAGCRDGVNTLRWCLLDFGRNPGLGMVWEYLLHIDADKLKERFPLPSVLLATWDI